MVHPGPYSPNSLYDNATQDEKNWGMIAHGVPLFAMWASAGFLGFVAGIVVYVLAKDKGPLARNYSAQALNIQLNALIWFIVSVVLMLVLIGFVLIFVVAAWATILHLIGLVKSSKGEMWHPPLVIPFIR